LLREKLVWLASHRCVVIADQGKTVETLGRFPLPIEVVEFGARHTAEQFRSVLETHGIDALPTLRVQSGAPVRTDSGNLIYDAPCKAIANPTALAGALKNLTGVVEHGLFLGLADRALVGTDHGVITLHP